jgi:hypothetical protein
MLGAFSSTSVTVRLRYVATWSIGIPTERSCAEAMRSSSDQDSRIPGDTVAGSNASVFSVRPCAAGL